MSLLVLPLFNYRVIVLHSIKLVFTLIDRFLVSVIRPVVITLSLIIATMFALGIFTRSVLDSPLFGLEEILLVSVMWLYMLGAVLASKERSHLGADLVQVVTHNKRVIHFFSALSSLISLFMAVMFSIWSFDLVAWGVEKQQSTPVFHIPWYISQASLFLAGILMVFYTLRDVVKDFKDLLASDANQSSK